MSDKTDLSRMSIKELGDLFNRLIDVSSDPLVIKEREAVREAEKKFTAACDVARARNASRLDAVQAELNRKRETAYQKRNSRFPEGCPEWMWRAVQDAWNGMEEKRRVRIVLYSSKYRMVWVNIPGHMLWSGRGDQSYAPSHYYLLDLSAKIRSGWSYRKEITLREHTGRVSTKELEAMMKESWNSKKLGLTKPVDNP